MWKTVSMVVSELTIKLDVYFFQVLKQISRMAHVLYYISIIILIKEGVCIRGTIKTLMQYEKINFLSLGAGGGGGG